MKQLVLTFGFIITFYTATNAQDSITDLKPTGTVARQPVTKLIKTVKALGISTKVQMRIAKIKNPPINIALFAVDRINNTEKGNSDVIMIITVDPVTKKIKMSSILRDTYIDIEGRGMNKLNAAFAIGGPQLAIKTLNQNFELDIKDYINLDFFSAARIIDALGGVTINVKPEEIYQLNHYLTEISNVQNIYLAPLKDPGIQKLNGKQAVAYTRIRTVGNGDYERTERQRTVLIALFEKIHGAGSAILPVLVTEVLPNLETSMTNSALFNIGNEILNSGTKAISQARFPIDSSSKGKRINNTWYLTTDLNATRNSIYNFIYNDITPRK